METDPCSYYQKQGECGSLFKVSNVQKEWKYRQNVRNVRVSANESM
ncbi:hypothetical protein NQ318_019005 [Aromia moschata]|uniref:Uncharacterized protein n=1 Tax=Aromia moschata TaxID=1265417 RepID=A0AAV8YF13_9CUCU|nr:hypothetical protein NQ318_019005 [Aromia moschata]